MGTNYQKPIAEDMEGFGKVGAEMCNIKSRIHSADDSAESVPDSDLADGELLKMLASPPCAKSRGLYRKEEQVQSVLKVILEKAGCQVRLRNREHT